MARAGAAPRSPASADDARDRAPQLGHAEQQLETLDGIGPSLAQRIIDYRTAARRLPLAGRARPRERVRPGADGRAARPCGAVTRPPGSWWRSLAGLVGAACTCLRWCRCWRRSPGVHGRLLAGGCAGGGAVGRRCGWSALEHRALSPGPIDGVVVVTGAPSGDRAVGRLVAAGEDVLLRGAAAYRSQLGGIYRVDGPAAADRSRRCATTTPARACTCELSASRLAWLGRPGRRWGVVDRAAPRRAARAWARTAHPSGRAGAGGGRHAGRDGRAALRRCASSSGSRGCTHLVAASGQNVALVVIFALACLGAAAA